MRKFYVVISIITVLFILVSILSIISIRRLEGNASVVNYCGIVRGATQKLIKEELMEVQDDPLIDRLTSIVNNLQKGGEPFGLVVLNSEDYMECLRKIQIQWAELKRDIEAVRLNPSEETRGKLFRDSQAYFDLANETTFQAQKYSEDQVVSAMRLLLGIDGAFVLLFLIGVAYVLRGVIISRNASNPDRISYIDPMTDINNRASCDRLISKINMAPSMDSIAVIMFNMNDITAVNNKLGQRTGDKLITEFAHIMRDVSKDYGFVGRYGGDEFLAIIAKATDQTVRSFLKGLDRAVWSYNAEQREHLRKISFAVGYIIGNQSQITIDDMIYEAYRNMTENKDRIKNGLI